MRLFVSRLLSKYKAITASDGWKNKGCLVLNYHGLVEKKTDTRLERNFHTYDSFQNHIRYISKYKRIVSAQELVHAIESKEDVTDLALITFDDGYKNNLIIPELLGGVHKNIPFTVFVSTGYLGQDKESIWTVNVSLLLLKSSAQSVVFNGSVYDLGTREEKETAFRTIRVALKNMNSSDRLEAYEDLLNQFEQGTLEHLLNTCTQFRMMNWADCAQLLTDNGDIQSHGVMHELHHVGQEDDTIDTELRMSSKAIFDHLKYNPVAFAYPNGDHNNYSLSQLPHNNYKLAFTTKHGYVNEGDDVFKLNRITPSEAMDKFILQL